MAQKKKRAFSRARKKSAVHHWFFPGKHNAFQPLFLRTGAIAMQITVIGLLFGIAWGIEQLVIRSPSPQIGAVVASVLVELANADRGDEGLATLALSPTLTEAAQMKADDMAAREYFAHETPEGEEPWHWFQKAGYTFKHAGENLAVYFSDSAEVEQAWMASPKHRANILSENYTEIGIAIAHGRYQGYETTFVVQMFGAPAAGSGTVFETSVPTPSESETVAGASAEARPIGAITSQPPSTLWRILSTPHTTLEWAYTGIAGFVLLAIALLFLSELRRLHVPSLMRGAGVLALIAVLLYGSTLISSGLLIL